MLLKAMCDTCIHRFYCIAAYKKDHWCGNHTEEREVRKCERQRLSGRERNERKIRN